MKLSISPQARGAFTLTEVLVSSALIVAIMALMFTTLEQTRKTINATTSRVSQFQSARVAFESMTRTLNQATLNTYYDLDRTSDRAQNPLRYRRQSDLHFVSGAAFQPKFFTAQGEGEEARTPAHYPGHAIFFQAPLGVTSEENSLEDKARRYRGLSSLLSVVGFYVKWDDDPVLPRFAERREDVVSKRWRFRLMQVQQPAETVMVYADSNYTNLTASGAKASPGAGFAGATDWIKVALGDLPFPAGFRPPEGTEERMDYSRGLAENIVAIIIIPKLPERDRSSPNRLDDLSSNYEYDSCPQIAFDSQKREFNPNDPASNLEAQIGNQNGGRTLKQLHQLPPILQVTMVAIDETSAQKLQDYSEDPHDFTIGLFRNLSTEAQFLQELGDPANPDSNSLVHRLSNPDGALPTPRLNYRIFTSDVVLRGSKWSKN